VVASPIDDELKAPPLVELPPGSDGGWLVHKMSRQQELVFDFTLCMVQLLPQACLTTCFPIIQIISADFNIQNPALLSWVVAAYALSFGTTILLAGRLGDIFGHRNIVVLGFAWLSFWSVVGGLSRYTTSNLFFASRAMQGLGAAMMNANALALLGRSYPPNAKGKITAFSAFGLCAPLGTYTGMLGSAILGQLTHWSWCFYTLAIASAALCVVAAFVLPSPPKTPKQMLPFMQKLGHMDWLGSITGVGGLVLVQVALVSAPVQGWTTQYIYMLLILGLVLIVFFVVVQLKISTEPLVPFKLLNSNVAFVLSAVACGWATFGVWTYYLWRFLLRIWHDQPLTAALRALPVVPVALIAAILTAVLMRKIKPAWTLLGALIAFTLGPFFLSFNQPTSSYWTFTFFSLLVTPFGMDMSSSSATFIMSNSLPLDKQGVASSLVATVVNYSISLGLGLASTVEVHVNNNGLDLMKGFRGGSLFGVGLGSLGILICTLFVLKTTIFSSPSLTTTPSNSFNAKQPQPPPFPVSKPPPSSSSSSLTTHSRRRRSSPFSRTTSTISPPTHFIHISKDSSETDLITNRSISITNYQNQHQYQHQRQNHYSYPSYARAIKDERGIHRLSDLPEEMPRVYRNRGSWEEERGDNDEARLRDLIVRMPPQELLKGI